MNSSSNSSMSSFSDCFRNFTRDLFGSPFSEFIENWFIRFFYRKLLQGNLSEIASGYSSKDSVGIHSRDSFGNLYSDIFGNSFSRLLGISLAFLQDSFNFFFSGISVVILLGSTSRISKQILPGFPDFFSGIPAGTHPLAISSGVLPEIP